MIGRPPIHAPVGAFCEQCEEAFFRKPYAGERLRFCGNICRNEYRPAKGQPRKLPATAEVVRLYVKENLPTTEIGRRYGANHKTVRTHLLRAGVALRKYTTPLICRVKDCGRPALKVIHRANASMYGTLCAEHRALHRRQLNREIARKNRGIDPSRYNPWRLKENEQERKWLSNARSLLKQAQRLANSAAMLPAA
jgi:hypothetical protein